MTNNVDAVTLGVIHVLGLSFLGLDRMVCGCYLSGFLKLFMFILAIAFLFIAPVIGIILLIAWGIWAFIDYVVVTVALLSNRLNVPLFCDMRIDPASKDTGRILGYVALFLLVVGSIVPLVGG